MRRGITSKRLVCGCSVAVLILSGVLTGALAASPPVPVAISRCGRYALRASLIEMLDARQKPSGPEDRNYSISMTLYSVDAGADPPAFQPLLANVWVEPGNPLLLPQREADAPSATPAFAGSIKSLPPTISISCRHVPPDRKSLSLPPIVVQLVRVKTWKTMRFEGIARIPARTLPCGPFDIAVEGGYRDLTLKALPPGGGADQVGEYTKWVAWSYIGPPDMKYFVRGTDAAGHRLRAVESRRDKTGHPMLDLDSRDEKSKPAEESRMILYPVSLAIRLPEAIEPAAAVFQFDDLPLPTAQDPKWQFPLQTPLTPSSLIPPELRAW